MQKAISYFCTRHKMKLDLRKIQFINLFENLTKASVLDFYEEETLIFIVKEGNLRQALGRKNENLRRLEGMFKKKIRIIEFNKNPEIFLKNFTYPLSLKSINVEKKIATVYSDMKTKGLLIGRDHKNLQMINEIFKRYFDMEVKVR